MLLIHWKIICNASVYFFRESRVFFAQYRSHFRMCFTACGILVFHCWNSVLSEYFCTWLAVFLNFQNSSGTPYWIDWFHAVTARLLELWFESGRVAVKDMTNTQLCGPWGSRDLFKGDVELENVDKRESFVLQHRVEGLGRVPSHRHQLGQHRAAQPAKPTQTDRHTSNHTSVRTWRALGKSAYPLPITDAPSSAVFLFVS